MPKGSLNVSLKGADDIFSTEESRQEQQREQVQQIPIGELFPFKNHLFKVLDDESMQRTVESVEQYGVLSPLIARPRPEGGYEIISGHRRQHAAQLAGLDTLPVIVRNMDDDAAVLLMVDSNLQRETILPSERAFAYKMKLEAMHILDEIIDKMVRQIFSRLRGIPKEQLITSRYAKETAERKNHLQALQAERDKAEKDLLALKAEILAVIKGESAFPKDTLAEMIAAQEKKHTELETLCEEASAELERNAELMANVSQLYEELISYADLYDSASFEAKKMIVSQLIRRVEVYRGYQIHVDFNFDLAQYLENSDELAC